MYLNTKGSISLYVTKRVDWHRWAENPPLVLRPCVSGRMFGGARAPAPARLQLRAELNERRPQSESDDEQRGGQAAEMRAMSQPRHDLVAQGPQAPLQVQGLCLRQVQSHRWTTTRHGCSGKNLLPIMYGIFIVVSFLCIIWDIFCVFLSTEILTNEVINKLTTKKLIVAYKHLPEAITHQTHEL